MRDVIEVSYTGDLLGHRRCPRSWAFEKQAGFHPYEQVQAMEGRLIHHAMEWLTREFRSSGKHRNTQDLTVQLTKYFRVLWARGMRTTFASKADTVDRVVRNLFPNGKMHKTVRSAIEGAQHTEYELRSVRKVVKADFAGKSRLLLTGILDLVVQQQNPLIYEQTWEWTDLAALEGKVANKQTHAAVGDVEIWDYKGARAGTHYLTDYVRQLLTYAALYKERSGALPKRCVLFFVNEPKFDRQLLVIPVDQKTVDSALDWTIKQVQAIRQTSLSFQAGPTSVSGGAYADAHLPIGSRVNTELKQQCTACGFRFDCAEYITHLGGPGHTDIDILNVHKN